MQNYQNDLQMLGMDPYQVGQVIPYNSYSQQILDDPRRCGGRCGGCGGRCGGFGGRCGGFRCGGFGCVGCVGCFGCVGCAGCGGCGGCVGFGTGVVVV